MFSPVTIVQSGGSTLYATFQQGESDLNLGLDDTPVGIPVLSNTNWGFFGLAYNTAEANQNFKSLVKVKLAQSDPDMNFSFSSLYFDGRHYIKTPAGEDEINYEGITKNATSYSLTLHFQVTANPQAVMYLMHVGDNVEHIKITPLMQVVYTVNGTQTITSQSVTVGGWHSVRVVYQNGGKQLYVNGVLAGSLASSTPANAGALPYKYGGTDTGANMFVGRMRCIHLFKGTLSSADNAKLDDADIIPKIIAKNARTGAEIDITSYAYKHYQAGTGVYKHIYPKGYIGCSTPSTLANGFYHIYTELKGVRVRRRSINIKNFTDIIRNTAITDDFTNRALTLNTWELAHKSWGWGPKKDPDGNPLPPRNGGVAAQLVDITSGEVRCYGQGDLATQGAYGVDMLGFPLADNMACKIKRVGSCIISKEYYAPGVFNFWCKFPQHTGACAAIWTFHYEEIYPDNPMWNAFKAEGLSEQGSPEDGYYIVRNHEIDIEAPTALKGAPDMEVVSYNNARFNSWIGEKDGEYTDIFMAIPPAPKSLNDGQYHKMTIDWNTFPNDKRVKFYVDDVLATTITTHVPTIPMKLWFGVWYPSTLNNYWAGKQANYERDYFALRKFQYTPYVGAPIDPKPEQKAAETYPKVGVRPITYYHFSDV